MKYLFVCFALLGTLTLHAQNPVSWSIASEKVAENEYVIVATATINDGWYVYSQYLENDNGPIATELVIESGSYSTVNIATEEGEKISGFDNMFDMNITKYKHKMVIKQQVKILEKTTLKGYLTFMTCNDESCLPPNDVEFSLDLK